MAKGPGGFSVGRVSIQVVPDTSKFREKLLAELKKEIKGLKVEIPVDVDAAKAVAQLKALDKIIKRLDGRDINIGTTVKSKGDLDSIPKNLSKIGRSASETASGFGEIGRTGAIVLAVLLLIAPALALIATLLAGLPSLLFAFGGAAAAIGLGLDGLKKAAQGFTPTIDRLKKSLSANFEKNLTKPFQELNKIAPVLDTGLNGIATSLSGIISDMIRFVTSAKGMSEINTILSNTAGFFNDLRPAISDGLGALVQLAAVASTEFGGLAATFNRFAKNFKDIVESASDTGLLTSALRNLNVVLDSLLDAFNQFFQAGLEAMTVLGGPIAILFDGFTKGVVDLLPILTAISKLVFEVFGEAFKQLGPIFKELTPAFQLLGQLLSTVLVGALRAVGPLLTRVAGILSDVLVKVLMTIQPFIPQFIDFFTKLATLVGDFLVSAFESLSPFLDLFLKFITDLLVAITPLLPQLIQFATEVLKSIAQVLQEIGPSLVEVGQDLFPKLLTVIKDLVPIAGQFLVEFAKILPLLVELATALLDVAVPAMKALFQTISEVWPAIKQIILGVLDVVKGTINLVLGIISGDWDRAWKGLKQILDGAAEAIKGGVKALLITLVDQFIALPNRLLGPLFGLPSQMMKSGQAIVQGLIDGIKSKLAQAGQAISSVVEHVRSFLPFSPAKRGPLSGSGYTLFSGRALMEDWAKGIEQGTPAAVRAVEEAMNATQSGVDVNAAVTSDGFGDLQGQIMSAMSGWEVTIDANGITKLVNRTNQRNSRR